MNKIQVFISSVQKEFAKEKSLKEPEFIQDESFKTIIWRTFNATHQPTLQASEQVSGEATHQATLQATHQATLQANEEVLETVKRIVLVMDGDMKRAEIQEILGLKDRTNFVSNYLMPSLDLTFIEMTIPEIPTHKEQRYRLTAKGKELKKKLQKAKKKK